MEERRHKVRGAREGFEDSWPALSRLAGMALLIYSVALAPPSDRPMYIGVVLVLLTAPTVTGAQLRRNRRRDREDDD